MSKLENLAVVSRYVLVGAANTLFGYVCIFGFMFAGFSAEISNAFGYAIGFVVSYFGHKLWTFKSAASHKRDLPKYVFTVAIAYLLNLGALTICVRELSINAYISQFIAGAVYIVVSFALLRNFAFPKMHVKF